MNHHDLSGLSQRLLGKAWEQATAVERAVLTQLHGRQRTNVSPADRTGDDRSFGERVADNVARFGGSWTFIASFGLFLALWVVSNVWLLRTHPFDPYPFIFLNLLLSMLAALQAPVIMMSQNRQAAVDRLRAQNDYEVNIKSELEILQVHEKLNQLREQDWATLVELQNRQIAMLQQLLERAGGLSPDAPAR
jgi:uncharacterized membrane protein